MTRKKTHSKSVAFRVFLWLKFVIRFTLTSIEQKLDWNIDFHSFGKRGVDSLLAEYPVADT